MSTHESFRPASNETRLSIFCFDELQDLIACIKTLSISTPYNMLYLLHSLQAAHRQCHTQSDSRQAQH